MPTETHKSDVYVADKLIASDVPMTIEYEIPHPEADPWIGIQSFARAAEAMMQSIQSALVPLFRLSPHLQKTLLEGRWVTDQELLFERQYARQRRRIARRKRTERP